MSLVRASKWRRAFRWIFTVWGILTVGDLLWYLRRAFSRLPTDETYSDGVAFQIIAFSLTTLPVWLAGLILLLVIDYWVFRRRFAGPSKQ